MTQTRTHNAANEITAIDSSDANVAHDAAGNMTRVPSLDADWPGHYHMVYDAWNRLVEVQDATESYEITQIEYNGLNQRIVKTSYADSESQPATVYLYYNDRWQCVEERPDDGEGLPTAYPTYRYVWGPRYIDELIYRDQCNTGTGALVQRLYAMQDANYNVVALAEEDGDVVERFIYDAYGRATVLDPAFTADADNASDYAWTHLYTGRPLDPETGLMDYRNRCYHTGLGRFVTRDPIGYEGGDPNLYRYVMNRPSVWTDPQGTVPITCECYKHWYNWETATVTTDCAGLASTCCKSACCSSFYSWTGNWDVVGARPSPPISIIGAMMDVFLCEARCEASFHG